MFNTSSNNLEPSGATADSPRSDQPPCPLLDKLPPEIRDIIWGYALPSNPEWRIAVYNRTHFAMIEHLNVRRYPDEPRNRPFGVVHDLAATSRQVRSEAIATFGRQNRFFLVTLPATHPEDYNPPAHICRPSPMILYALQPIGQFVHLLMRNFTVHASRLISKYQVRKHKPYARCRLQMRRGSIGNGEAVVNLEKGVKLKGCNKWNDGQLGEEEFDESDKRLVEDFERNVAETVAGLLKKNHWSLNILAEILDIVEGMGMSMEQGDLVELEWPQKSAYGIAVTKKYHEVHLA